MPQQTHVPRLLIVDDGANAYLIKPFGLGELLALILATLPAGRLEPGIFQAIIKNQLKFRQNFLFGSIADRLKKNCLT
jgi:DNA-binding response OmpR family regulator